MNFKQLIQSPEYNFLRTDPHLGNKIILLGLGGSHAYGTNTENSDIDIRGITLQSRSDLLGMTDFDQYVDNETDTTVYGFNKIVKLLLECNPNTIEMLGLDADQYLIKTELGQELLDHRHLFLSKRAIHSFGGYATAQLRRLQNATARDSMPQNEREMHIMKSAQNAMEDMQRKAQAVDKGTMNIYIDKSDKPEMETEIFVDTNITHMPLRDFKDILNSMLNVIRDYDKLGQRNHKKDDNHLNKHAMHLIRLYMMCIDILEKEEIITHRPPEDLALLRSIRNGDFMQTPGILNKDFYDILDDYEKRMDEAAKKTKLPDLPDMQRVEEFVMYINRKTIISIHTPQYNLRRDQEDGSHHP